MLICKHMAKINSVIHLQCSVLLEECVRITVDIVYDG